MKQDLDRLMAEHHLDAFIIPPTEGHNPQRAYLTGGVHANGMVIKKRGENPILIVNHMEMDEAQKSGLEVHSFDRFQIDDIWKQHGRDTLAARVEWWKRVVGEMNLTGRITFYGAAEMQYALKIGEIFQQHLPQSACELITDRLPNVLALAMQTKDAEELAIMREVGLRASAVMRKTREWLGQQHLKAGIIVNEQGEPLTIGQVKRYVRILLLEHDLEDSEGMIFAQGRDAGVPHSKGEANAPLKAGEAIVFDLFPREMNGYYYHDMTRTWCLGNVPDDVQRDYELVLEVYGRSLEGINLGEPTQQIATQVCEWFEAAGHLSRLSTPNAITGYNHALGHGLGVSVHEYPTISHLSPQGTVFQAGHVVTIEPGLYYPERGYGIRIEDTLYLDEHGDLHNLSDCPYDLLIPLG